MTSAPWRLPQPPGLRPNATSMRGHATAAAAAGLSADDDAPVFSFQRRYHKLNWREILHIDLNRIIQHVDLAALHEQLEPLTFADIGEDGQTGQRHRLTRASTPVTNMSICRNLY